MLNFGNYNEHVQNKELVDIWKNYLGTDLSAEAIYRLIGAPEGSIVRAEYNEWNGIFEQSAAIAPVGLYFNIKHPLFESCIGIYNSDEENGHRLYIHHFCSTYRGKGIAGRCLIQMMAIACCLGIKSIHLFAWGGRLCSTRKPRWTGHIAWPKYGFDMFIDNAEQQQSFKLLQEELDLRPLFQHYPENLYLCNTVQDIYDLEHGETWWALCGTGWFMSLQCSRTSWQQLRTKLEKKGHNIRDDMHFDYNGLSALKTELSQLTKSRYKANCSVEDIETLLEEGKFLSAPQLSANEFFQKEGPLLSNDFMN